jgi:CO/xanthine dehydrogenase Mo-binding subunit
MSAPSEATTRPRGAVGDEAVRPDVAAKLDGSFAYSNDLWLPGTLFGATVRSPHAHARITRLDTAAAIGTTGVVDVLTAADVPGSALVGHIAADQPVFARDVVRHEGEPVAFVIAHSQEAARRAAATMLVGYQPLPVLDDPGLALGADVPLLHPDGNLVRRVHIHHGDAGDAEVVVDGVWHTGRQDQAFLAPESALAVPDDDGGVTLHCATQDVHTDRDQIASALGLPGHLVRVVLAGVGGAFGGREDITCQVHLCLAARRTGRPVKTTYLRSESFLAHPKRHPARLAYRVGADRDGTLRFVEARILLDGGPYASTSGPVTGSAAYFAAGPYRVPSVDVVAESVRTNNPIAGAMRGFGAVQACFGIESTIDLLADRLGMDPVELRRRNVLVPGDAFPTSGQRVDGAAPLHELIDRCIALPLPVAPGELPGATGRTADATRTRRGTGFALGVKNHLYGEGVPEHATAVVRVDRHGVELRSAATEVGQGIGSALIQIVRTVLGALDVRLAPASSALDYAGSSSASRQTWMSGAAVEQAALDARAQLAARGAFVDGHVVPDALGDEVVEGRATYHAPHTFAADPSGRGDVHVSWMFVAHRAVVDVDVDLGLVRVAQVATAQDVGLALNPREVRGQIDGGISQGIGLALTEHLRADRGLVANASFTDYLVPTIADMAPTEVALVEVPDPRGPFGLKGVGEPPSLSSTPAIAAAVRRATGRPVPRVPIRPEDLLTLP